MSAESKPNGTERMNSLAIDATQTFIDAAYLAQRQSAQLLQAWLNALDAGQQEQRDIASQLIKQSQEAQTLLQQFIQESSQLGADAFTRTTNKG